MRGKKLKIGVGGYLVSNPIQLAGLKACYPECEIVRADDLMVALRSVKDADEVEEIRSYLEREDFMDYTFIIAEEYVHRGMPVKAFQILRTIALEEERKPYFKHFYPEVLILLWRIVRGPIEEDEDDALRLSMMKELSDLDYTDKDRARIYKAMAEIYLKRSDLYMAAQNYKGAEKSYPKLPGMSKLKRKVEAFLQE